ncbi:sensor histidine kinase [Polaribacter uvawellassae]|uniref:sensor histidine kinase n=1 Tax=Polaribacter uvawellassae TaxID=3133495 RepID=UPI00321B445E
MNKFLSLIFLVFILISCSSTKNDASQELYKSVTFLNQKNDSLSINDVIKLYKKGDFNIAMENKIIFNLKDLPTSWFHFKIDNLNEDKYFSIWSPFLEYGKVYLYYNNTIKELNALDLNNSKDYNSEYRFPTWKLNQTNTTTHVFVKVRDTKRATSLKLLLFNSSEFIKYTQKDSTIIALLLAFFLAMLVAISSLFIVKKQYSLLWYAGYVFAFAFDLINSHGIDLQLQIFSTPTEHSVKRLLFQSIGAACIGMFYISFYPFTKETKYIRKAFKYITGFYFLSVIILLSFILVNDIYLPKIFLWLPQRIMVFFIIIGHLILIRKKVIPFYLSIGFLATLLIYIRFLYSNPGLDLSLASYFFIDNHFYITIAIETALILFYIISQLVKSEFLAISLKNENLTLRSDFQDSVLNMQQQERNKLLGNVHDSFGGYLEALKLRLLTKAENTPEKIQEILDAFYKEYRYLLNSLYAPKINSENFIESLIDFFDKLNQLTNSNSIQHQFSIDNTQFSQKKCVHLYRIISELTTNAIKHANASEININLSQENNKNILLKISDNGIGFDKSNIAKNSYGLSNIEKRVKDINGKITIETEKNKGTEIKISIPIDE